MKCQHPACECTDATLDRNGRKFCSDRCAQDAESASAGRGCDCGHPDCEGVA